MGSGGTRRNRRSSGRILSIIWITRLQRWRVLGGGSERTAQLSKFSGDLVEGVGKTFQPVRRGAALDYPRRTRGLIARAAHPCVQEVADRGIVSQPLDRHLR